MRTILFFFSSSLFWFLFLFVIVSILFSSAITDVEFFVFNWRIAHVYALTTKKCVKIHRNNDAGKTNNNEQFLKISDMYWCTSSLGQFTKSRIQNYFKIFVMSYEHINVYMTVVPSHMYHNTWRKSLLNIWKQTAWQCCRKINGQLLLNCKENILF